VGLQPRETEDVWGVRCRDDVKGEDFDMRLADGHAERSGVVGDRAGGEGATVNSVDHDGNRLCGKRKPVLGGESGVH
jgi:hypothetical protein